MPIVMFKVDGKERSALVVCKDNAEKWGKFVKKIGAYLIYVDTPSWATSYDDCNFYAVKE